MAAGCLGLLFIAAPRAAAEYEQKQGRAVVRLDAPQGKDGRVEVRLSGVLLTAVVEGKPPLKVEWETILPPSTKAWKARKVAAAGSPETPGQWEQKYYLEPLGKPDETLDLPLQPLKVTEAGKAEPAVVTWKPIPVRITTEIKKAALSEMRPNTSPEEVPPAGSWREPVAWVGLGLVVVTLGMIVWELVRRRARRATVLTPHGWALRELDRLTALDLSVGEEVERFPTLLSDVVRRYLELRFRLRASRQTTTEFLEAMQRSPQLTAEQQAVLRDFLQRCDLAKFARLTPSAEECQALAGVARGFVEQTAVPATVDGAAPAV